MSAFIFIAPTSIPVVLLTLVLFCPWKTPFKRAEKLLKLVLDRPRRPRRVRRRRPDRG